MKKLLLYFSLVVAAMTGCTDTDDLDVTTTPTRDEATFTSTKIVTMASRTDFRETWTGGEQIGVLMRRNIDADTGIDTYSLFENTSSGSTATFKAVSATDKIVLDDYSAKIVAYYPYTESLPENGAYAFSSDDMTDLLVASKSGVTINDNVSTGIELDFNHVLSKIQLKVVNKEGGSYDLSADSVSAQILNFSTSGSYDIYKQSFSFDDSKSTQKLDVAETNNDYEFETVFLPQDFGTARLSVYANGIEARIAFTELIENATSFEQASIYTIKAVATIEGFDFSISNIEGWDDSGVDANGSLQTGSEANPILISSQTAMDKFAAGVSDGSIETEDVHFKLTTDVTATTPIGSDTYPFKGVFDGDNKTITVVMSSASEIHNGIFGRIDSPAIVKNIKATGSIKVVLACRSAGIIAGCLTNGATITNVEVYDASIDGGAATSTAATSCGGVAGLSFGVINLAKVTNITSVNSGTNSGGLVGYANSATEIYNSYVDVATIHGTSRCGGAVGYAVAMSATNLYVKDADVTVDGEKKATVFGQTSTSSVVSNVFYYSTTGSGLYTVQNNAANTTYTNFYSLEGSTLDVNVATLSTVLTAVEFTGAGNTNLPYLLNYYAGMYNSGLPAYPLQGWAVVQDDGYPTFTGSDAKEVTSDGTYSDGVGNEGNPYVLETNADITTFTSYLASGATGEGLYYKLGFSPSITATLGSSFAGNLDGNGNTITVAITSESETAAGVFGALTSTASISNVTITGSVATTAASASAGALAASNAGVISGVTISGVTVSGTDCVGALAGENTGVINLSSVSGTVSVSAGSDGTAGVLAGSNSGAIYNSYVEAATISEALVCGGLVGNNSGYIYNAYALEGALSGTTSGALVGSNTGTVAGAYYYSATTGFNAVFGSSTGTCTRVYFNTDAATDADATYATVLATDGFVTSAALYLNGYAGNVYNVTDALDYYLMGWDVSGSYPTLTSTVCAFQDNDGYFTSGNGSVTFPYILSSDDDMAELVTYVENGNTTEGLYFNLTENVTQTAVIGTTAALGFAGTFDGGGNTILVDISASTYAGVFGCVTATGVVKNLRVEGTITSSNHTGGIVGYNYGYIYNVSAKVEVLNTLTKTGTGGIAGYMLAGSVVNYAVVEDGSTISNTGATGYSGGIVGDSYGQIINCAVYATSVSAISNNGGIVGIMRAGPVYNSYVVGTTVSSSALSGWFANSAANIMSNCYYYNDDATETDTLIIFGNTTISYGTTSNLYTVALAENVQYSYNVLTLDEFASTDGDCLVDTLNANVATANDSGSYTYDWGTWELLSGAKYPTLVPLTE